MTLGKSDQLPEALAADTTATSITTSTICSTTTTATTDNNNYNNKIQLLLLLLFKTFKSDAAWVYVDFLCVITMSTWVFLRVLQVPPTFQKNVILGMCFLPHIEKSLIFVL